MNCSLLEVLCVQRPSGLWISLVTLSIVWTVFHDDWRFFKLLLLAVREPTAYTSSYITLTVLSSVFVCYCAAVTSRHMVRKRIPSSCLPNTLCRVCCFYFLLFRRPWSSLLSIMCLTLFCWQTWKRKSLKPLLASWEFSFCADSLPLSRTTVSNTKQLHSTKCLSLCNRVFL